MNRRQIRTGVICRTATRSDFIAPKQRWLHSDMKDMAFFYTYKLYKELVELGGL
jgi:hypothetical protein